MAVVLSLIIAAAATFGTAAAPGRAKGIELSEQQIKGIALSAARQAGDRHPSLIQHAAGSRYQANQVASRDIVPGSLSCYLIAVRGAFVLNNASGPPGAKPPKGTVLTLVVDAKTGATLDFGVADRYPDLKKLGPVTTDLRN